MDILHNPALFLAIAAAIGYVLPLVSARLNREHWYASRPELEGIITLVLAAITGLGAELAHAAVTTGVDFSWSAWFTTAITALGTSVVGYIQSWNNSRTAANLRAKGSTAAAAPPAAPKV